MRLHRHAAAEDVAQLVIFRAASEPCYIIGQDFKIDGFQYNMSAPRGGVRIAPFVQSHPRTTPAEAGAHGRDGSRPSSGG